MEGYIGEVRMFGGTFAPRAWAFCQGQLMSIAEYTPLYALIGTIYGGNGQNTFALPDLRGRRAVHSGNSAGPGLQEVYLGEVYGTENVTITNSTMPVHSHLISATMTGTADFMFENNDAAGSLPPTNNYYALASENVYGPGGDIIMSPMQISPNFSSMSLSTTGGSQPMNLITPYQAVNYIICLEGIFPSRN